MLRFGERKIEIFGEPVGLEEALLQACAAFENPALRKLFVLVDAREHPSEHIVLLDDMGRERSLLSDRKDFALLNHIVSRRAQR